MLRIVLLALLFLLPAALAHAEDCGKYDKQGDMNACANREAQKADAALNKLYGQIRARLKDSPDQLKQLTATQRAWVAFRDAECTFSSSSADGGSIHAMVYSICLEGLTLKRTEDFKAYLKCEEGDVSCPVPAE